MKKLLTITAAVVALTASSNAFAATIAVLDAQEVINKTNAAVEARKILKSETKKAQSKIDALEADVMRKQKTLEGKKGVISEEKYLDEEAALRKSVREFRAEAQSIQEALDRKNMKLKKEITDNIRVVVDKLAKEKKYDAVIAKNILLYSADSIDISAEVLKLVNKRMK